MSTTKTILGLVAVGAIGVAVGLLIAPEKGEKTRKAIKDSASDLSDKFLSLIADGKEKGDECLSELKGKAKDLKNDLKDKAENLKDRLKEDISKA